MCFDNFKSKIMLHAKTKNHLKLYCQNTCLKMDQLQIQKKKR